MKLRACPAHYPQIEIVAAQPAVAPDRLDLKVVAAYLQNRNIKGTAS